MQLASRHDVHLQALWLAARIEKAKEQLMWDERIVSAAVKLPVGTIVTLPMPARHHDILLSMSRSKIPGETYHQGTQGFFTSLGRFVDREKAMEIARKAGQVVSDTQNKRLFSEDLWK
jgi:hypothetical protein